MSIRAMDWAFRQTCKNSGQKLVLLKLADNANDQGECWPSLAYIGRFCQMTRSTVSQHCSDLAKQGLIEIIPRVQDGSNLPNVYRVLMPDLDFEPRPRKPGVRRVETGCSTQTNRVYGTEQPEPSEEPSVEPKATAPGGAGSFDRAKLTELAASVAGEDREMARRLCEWVGRAVNTCRKNREPDARTWAVIQDTLKTMGDKIASGYSVTSMWGLLEHVYKQQRTRHMQTTEHQANKKIEVPPEFKSLIGAISSGKGV